MEVFEALRTRASVRDFLPAPIPAEALEKLKEAALCAPTSLNLQQQRFCFITAPDILRTLTEGVIRVSEERGETDYLERLAQRDGKVFFGAPLVIVIAVGIMKPKFFGTSNLVNTLKNISIRYIIALGISGCLITTGNDLSAGRLAGFAACLACIFAQTEGASGKFYPNMPTLPTPVVFVLVIAICAIVGLCNGLVVSYLKVQPFIATLGMQQVVYGICLVYTGGTPIGSLNSNFTALAKDTLLAVPVLIWIALIVAVCFWFLYNKTRHGKYMYAIGGNEVAAEVSGVNTRRAKISIYMTAGIMYAIAGYLLAAKSGGTSASMGSGYELEAIAGCTIGGVSVNGGVGTIPGILIGVLVFEVLKIVLQFLGVESSYTYIAQGLVIIIAVALDLRKYLAKK